MERHPNPAINNPPNDGPNVVPNADIVPNTPIVRPVRPSGANDTVNAIITAAPTPCTALAPIKNPSEGAIPHNAEAAVNSPIPANKTRRRPNRSPTRPAPTIIVVIASKYAKTTHCAAGNKAPNAPAIAGNPAFAILVSSDAINIESANPQTVKSVFIPPPYAPTGESGRRTSCTQIVHRTPYTQSMALPDFNLLITLDAVLAEGSVAGAARRLQLSPSAMSRALARLRETTGDPLLVRAGRGLVPTPRANELREQVHQLVQDAQIVLRPTTPPNLKELERTFTIRAREGFAENFAPALLKRIAKEAPKVRLCFQQKGSKESTALRDGAADLETGVIGHTTHPELRAQALFHDRFIAVSRNKTNRYAKASHIALTRHGALNQQIDEALATPRKIAITVSTFSAALALARETDLIATVPERQTGNLRLGLYSYHLPFPAPTITISLIWHPRMDADPAHRWLRAVFLETCKPTG